MSGYQYYKVPTTLQKSGDNSGDQFFSLPTAYNIVLEFIMLVNGPLSYFASD